LSRGIGELKNWRIEEPLKNFIGLRNRYKHGQERRRWKVKGGDGTPTTAECTASSSGTQTPCLTLNTMTPFLPPLSLSLSIPLLNARQYNIFSFYIIIPTLSSQPM